MAQQPAKVFEMKGLPANEAQSLKTAFESHGYAVTLIPTGDTFTLRAVK